MGQWIKKHLVVIIAVMTLLAVVLAPIIINES